MPQSFANLFDPGALAIVGAGTVLATASDPSTGRLRTLVDLNTAQTLGTVSAVNADSYDENGDVIPQIYHGRTRAERHQELIRYGIEGGVAQVKRAFEIAGGQGAININVLWEMGGAQQVLEGVLERTNKKFIHRFQQMESIAAGRGTRLADLSLAEMDAIWDEVKSRTTQI